jgi:hypothetical protein
LIAVHCNFTSPSAESTTLDLNPIIEICTQTSRKACPAAHIPLLLVHRYRKGGFSRPDLKFQLFFRKRNTLRDPSISVLTITKIAGGESNTIEKKNSFEVHTFFNHFTGLPRSISPLTALHFTDISRNKHEARTKKGLHQPQSLFSSSVLVDCPSLCLPWHSLLLFAFSFTQVFIVNFPCIINIY